MRSKHTLDDFKFGDKVLWVPRHAHGDLNHKDCEKGFVSSVGKVYVFVDFGTNQAKGCSPDHLYKVKEDDAKEMEGNK